MSISYHGIYRKREKSFRPKPTEGNGQSGLLKTKGEIEKAIGPHGQGISGVDKDKMSVQDFSRDGKTPVNG